MRCNINFRQLSGCLRVIFIVGLLALLPSLSYASCDANGICTASESSALFTPSPNDQSVIYLGELFGSIPPVLAGTGSSLLGTLFKIFNTALLTLGIILAGYTTFVGILNTAGEGEMLGKGWSSIWVPIRTIAGIALLIPTASGYCVIQIFMMWLLVQGVGAADSLTSSIVDYMEKGQAVYVPGNTPNADGVNHIITTWDTSIDQVYQGLSCMQSLQKNYPQVNSAYVTPPSPTDANGNPATPTTNPIFYRFIANKYTSNTPDANGAYSATPVSCGEISFNNAAGNQAASTAYLTQGLSAIMPSLNAAAYFMVNDPATDENTIMSDTFNFTGSDFMNEVVRTYNSYVVQAKHAQAEASPNNYLDAIKGYGWITIGNLYWNMAHASDNEDVTTTPGAKLTWTTTDPDSNITTATINGKYNDMVGPDSSTSVYTDGHTYGNQFITYLINTRSSDNTTTGGTFHSSKKTNFSTAANGMMSALTLLTLREMQKGLSSNTTNPMVAAQKMGHHIVYEVEALMTAFVAFEIALGAAFTAMVLSAAPAWGFTFSVAGVQAFLATQFVLLVTMPFVFVLYGLLMTLGGVLAVIIPLIPAMVFFLAAIAWMVSTVETIVAAPIVAIGVVHPEGHQAWGKAEPAVMLITNMFLRPSLMVIGMAAGVLLSFISVQFVNFGYTQAMASVLGVHSANGDTTYLWDIPNGSGITWVEATMFLSTYVGLILACVNKSFSMIDALPDTVMRWIQGGEATRFGGGQEAMQKLQGSQESSGQKAAGDTMSSGQEGAQASDKALDKTDKAMARKDAEKKRNDTASLGGSGTST